MWKVLKKTLKEKNHTCVFVTSFPFKHISMFPYSFLIQLCFKSDNTHENTFYFRIISYFWLYCKALNEAKKSVVAADIKVINCIMNYKTKKIFRKSNCDLKIITIQKSYELFDNNMYDTNI